MRVQELRVLTVKSLGACVTYRLGTTFIEDLVELMRKAIPARNPITCQKAG